MLGEDRREAGSEKGGWAWREAGGYRKRETIKKGT